MQLVRAPGCTNRFEQSHRVVCRPKTRQAVSAPVRQVACEEGVHQVLMHLAAVASRLFERWAAEPVGQVEQGRRKHNTGEEEPDCRGSGACLLEVAGRDLQGEETSRPEDRQSPRRVSAVHPRRDCLHKCGEEQGAADGARGE